MSNMIDLTNKKFGRLYVIKKCDEKKYLNGEILWKCVCDCERKTILTVSSTHLRRGIKKSCGCIWKPNDEDKKIKLKSRLEINSKMNGQCQEWTGLKDKNGYGKISITENKKDRFYLVHEISWLIHKGYIPNDLNVLHLCNNPLCFRVDHLFLGKEFLRKNKNRYCKGSQHKKSKINEKIALEIYNLKNTDISSYELGKRYNLAASTIRSIWQKENWKHIH